MPSGARWQWLEPIAFAIEKAMWHTEIKTTMTYVTLGKIHIREQVERLNGIYPSAEGR